MGVPWWGWLIISVVGAYALLAVSMILLVGGSFWALWRDDRPLREKVSRRRP